MSTIDIIAMLLSIVVLLAAYVIDIRGRNKVHHHFCFSVLSAYRWFCGSKTRDMIDLISADLRRDVREMRVEGRSELFIGIVLNWRVLVGVILRLSSAKFYVLIRTIVWYLLPRL